MIDRMLQWFELNDLEPRKSQLEVIQKISDRWDAKYHILDLPTGVGKSFVGLAAGFAAGKSYVLTGTKHLQDQYRWGPGDVVVLKGRGNYPCKMFPRMTAESAPCATVQSLKKVCLDRGDDFCSYLAARSRALAADVACLNYSYFFYALDCGPLQSENPRDMIVMDEAHVIESALVSFTETAVDLEEVSNRLKVKTKGLRFPSDPAALEEVLVDVAHRVRAARDAAEGEIADLYESYGFADGRIPPDIPDELAAKVNRVAVRRDVADKMWKRLERWIVRRDSGEWLVHREDEKKCVVTPLRADGLFSELVSGAGDKFLMMSATIGSPEVFRRRLGVPKSEVNYVSAPSTFDPEKSAIVYSPVGSMSYRNIDETLPRMVKAVCEIISSHPDSKGIVHTGNYRVADAIWRGAPRSVRRRLLYRDAGEFRLSNADLIREHSESQSATVLISPSMTEGVSLDGDLGRFQVIVKCPFASLGDPRVKALAQTDRDWYQDQMWIALMQAAGRSTRSEEDFSVTYVLDSTFGRFFSMWKKRLPKWFVDRVVVVG